MQITNVKESYAANPGEISEEFKAGLGHAERSDGVPFVILKMEAATPIVAMAPWAAVKFGRSLMQVAGYTSKGARVALLLPTIAGVLGVVAGVAVGYGDFSGDLLTWGLGLAGGVAAVAFIGAATAV